MRRCDRLEVGDTAAEGVYHLILGAGALEDTDPVEMIVIHARQKLPRRAFTDYLVIDECPRIGRWSCSPSLVVFRIRTSTEDRRWVEVILVAAPTSVSPLR
jgi:hypothetical protein